MIISHTEECKQFCCRVHVNLFEFSAGVVGLVKIVNEGVGECLVGEESPIGDTNSTGILHFVLDRVGDESADFGGVAVLHLPLGRDELNEQYHEDWFHHVIKYFK